MTLSYLREHFIKVEKKYPCTEIFIEILRRGAYCYRSLRIIISAFPRSLGFTDERYRELKKYKNKHKGERCFIVATGPSLTTDDLNKISNEYTFSMNSIILAYDETVFRPKYYGIQDRNVYMEMYDKLVENSEEQKVFYAQALQFLWKKEEYKEYREKYIPMKSWIPIEVNGEYHMYDFNYTDRWHTRFHRNVYAYAYDGYSITYTLIELAVYMGFNEIYLLGCDSNYSKDKTKQHFKEHGIHDPEKYRITAGERLNNAYRAAKKYADKHGIKIYNATRGGMLEIFPRVNLDDVLRS